MKLKYMVMNLLLLIMLCYQAVFAVESPTIVLDKIANQVIQELRVNKATLKSNPNVVYRIVDRLLLPHVDVTAMSRSVLGREVWRSATPQQKARFSQEFIQVVVHTYASGLANYTDETVQFLPLREDYNNVSRMMVQSKIIRTDGPPISLDYRVILTGNGWKVYDMNVEGVSLLQSFRSEFANELAQGNLDQLIAELARRNANRGTE